MENSKKDLRGRVEPLPEIKQFEPFAYSAFDLPDPFRPRDLETAAAGKAGTGPAPDQNRRKETLEAFPLESLKMVGTLERSRVRYALIKTPDNNLYKAKVGNYMGQNFGIVTAVSETVVTLKEVVQDPANGGWSERSASLQLLEQ
ncbi:MAG: pilus assembly protein PilP [Burkholderiales bacterium]|nr:pilus assembly protein PilP [Burkholderiales bacterium]